MADTTQSLYTKSVLRLAQTLTIKFNAAALSMNRYLPGNYAVDPENPRTWPYYLHLAGQYHVSDSVMVITSLDTLEEIEFTYDNLLVHRATYVGYQYGTRYYNELVDKYPEQEDLILGILHPVDIDVAINAPDFSILYYDKDLVEEGEENLISSLQEWIFQFARMRYQSRYNVTQELYPAGFFVVLSTHLAGEILNIRKRNTRTDFVHSYHLWSYLGSHGRLNVYKEYLTRKQALWLYRNILYLEHNPGKTSTFVDLIEHVLTERNIPLVAYTVRHNVDPIPNEIYPDVEMAKYPQNRMAVNPFGIQVTTVEEVLSKELPVARENTNYYDEQVVSIPRRVKDSQFSKLPSKVLESEMIDRTDSLAIKFSDTLLNEWIYLASHNRYNAIVTVVNPYTQEMITMTVKEALILWIYCLHRQYEITLPYIPNATAMNVARPRIPSFSELRGISDPAYVTSNMIHVALQEYTPVGTVVSTETFYAKCVAIHDNIQGHRFLYSMQDDFRTRGYLDNVTKRFYQDVRCVLIEEKTPYADWFHVKNWKVDTLTVPQYTEFADEILKVATGANLKNVTSLKEIQAAMIRIMTQLSSYSVQFLKKINDGPATVIDMITIRPGNITAEAEISVNVDVSTRYFRDKSKAYSHIDTHFMDTVDFTRTSIKSTVTATLDPLVGFFGDPKITQRQRIKLNTVAFTFNWSPDISKQLSISALDGIWPNRVVVSPPNFIPNMEKSALDGLEVRKIPGITPLRLDNTDLNEPTGIVDKRQFLSAVFPAVSLGKFLSPYRKSINEIFPDAILDGFILPE